MEHFVRLDPLPEGLEAPPDLQGRFFLDAAKKRLVFRGFMSTADYQKLFLLDPGVEYHKALAELFQISSTEQARRLRHFRLLLSLLVIFCLLFMIVFWWQLLLGLP